MLTYKAIIMNRSNKTSEWRKKSESREKISNDEVGKRICKQYQLFTQCRIELRKTKNEKRLDKIEEAR